MVPSFPEPVTEPVTGTPIAGALLASPPPGIPEDLLDPDILASLYSFLINSESERFCVKCHSSVSKNKSGVVLI